MKNKRLIKYILMSFIVLFFTTFIAVIIENDTNSKQNEKINDEISKIINVFVDQYGLSEKEVIDIYLKAQNKDHTIINKYDFLNTTEYNNKIYLIPLITFILISLLYYFYIYRYNKRLKEIDNYLFQVLKGDYSLDIRDYKEDNLSILKNDIYKITVLLKEKSDSLEEEKKQLESTLSDISHQIKTPLTSILINNELLLKDKISNEDKETLINSNTKQLERINFLVTSLLKISRLNSGTVIMDIKKCNLSEIIKTSIENLDVFLEIKEIELSVELDENIYVEVDFNWTVEAIINILKNAINYTPNKGKIKIEAEYNPIYVKLEITNTGNTISKEDLPHIFKRFYRGQNAHQDSIGIGLNMTKNIIKKEKGDITVKSKDNNTTFTIKFYKV